MKTLIVYDSWYGNTAKIAEAVADGLGSDVTLVKANGDPFKDLAEAELLIVGSPTHGGVPTPAIKEFLQAIREGALAGKDVAAFDTRAAAKFLKIIGFAANRTAKQLQHKGGKLIAPPEGFYVISKEGPLVKGEIERAEQWAAGIIKHAQAAAFV